MTVEDGYFPTPNPVKPGEIVMAQRVTITIESNTMCDLFDSCKRVPFVASVSAMSSPAGFISFLGANAVPDAFQFIYMNFSYHK